MSITVNYLHDVEICQAFARRSREKMAEIRSGTIRLHTVPDELCPEQKLRQILAWTSTEKQ